MNPNVQVMIQALRAGKGHGQALTEYCWANLSLPIHRDSKSDPFKCDIASGTFGTMAAAKAFDCFDDGGSDDEIEAAFFDGMAWDREHTDIVWRTMLKTERPTFGDLIRTMPIDDQMKATEFFGIKRVAEEMGRQAMSQALRVIGQDGRKT